MIFVVSHVQVYPVIVYFQSWKCEKDPLIAPQRWRTEETS